MSKIVDRAKKAAAVAGAATTAFQVLVSVKGKPIRERDKPAEVRFCGLTVFDRDENGRQHVLFFRIRDARP